MFCTCKVYENGWPHKWSCWNCMKAVWSLSHVKILAFEIHVYLHFYHTSLYLYVCGKYVMNSLYVYFEYFWIMHLHVLCVCMTFKNAQNLETKTTPFLRFVKFENAINIKYQLVYHFTMCLFCFNKALLVVIHQVSFPSPAVQTICASIQCIYKS